MLWVGITVIAWSVSLYRITLKESGQQNEKFLPVSFNFIGSHHLFLFTIPATAQSPTPTPSTTDLPHGDKFILGDTYRLKIGEVLNGNLVVVGGTVTIDKGRRSTAILS
jgi:hypothetical protein